MVWMSPPDFKRLEQTTTLDLHIGGAELNVAVGASRLGLKCAWVSKLPDNPLGRMIANKARELEVDVSQVIRQNEGRVGLYFLELGASPRPSSVPGLMPSILSIRSAGETPLPPDFYTAISQRVMCKRVWITALLWRP